MSIIPPHLGLQLLDPGLENAEPHRDPDLLILEGILAPARKMGRGAHGRGCRPRKKTGSSQNTQNSIPNQSPYIMLLQNAIYIYVKWTLIKNGYLGRKFYPDTECGEMISTLSLPPIFPDFFISLYIDA